MTILTIVNIVNVSRTASNTVVCGFGIGPIAVLWPVTEMTKPIQCYRRIAIG